jgi:hypothetical protein
MEQEGFHVALEFPESVSGREEKLARPASVLDDQRNLGGISRTTRQPQLIVTLPERPRPFDHS